MSRHWCPFMPQLTALLGNEHEKCLRFKKTSFKHPLDIQTNVPKFPQGSERDCGAEFFCLLLLGQSLNPISLPPHMGAMMSWKSLNFSKHQFHLRNSAHHTSCRLRGTQHSARHLLKAALRPHLFSYCCPFNDSLRQCPCPHTLEEEWFGDQGWGCPFARWTEGKDE